MLKLVLFLTGVDGGGQLKIEIEMDTATKKASCRRRFKKFSLSLLLSKGSLSKEASRKIDT